MSFTDAGRIFRPLSQQLSQTLTFLKVSSRTAISSDFFFQVVQVMSSGKFFSAEEVDLSFNSETKKHPQISNHSFGTETVKTFFYKCSNSGRNESTPQTQNNVTWISSKTELEISNSFRNVSLGKWSKKWSGYRRELWWDVGSINLYISFQWICRKLTWKFIDGRIRSSFPRRSLAFCKLSILTDSNDSNISHSRGWDLFLSYMCNAGAVCLKVGNQASLRHCCMSLPILMPPHHCS